MGWAESGVARSARGVARLLGRPDARTGRSRARDERRQVRSAGATFRALVDRMEIEWRERAPAAGRVAGNGLSGGTLPGREACATGVRHGIDPQIAAI